MKKIQVLSLFLLLACGQIYGSANAELSFILAYQNIDTFNKSISAGNDDMQAVALLNAMSECIAFDQQQVAALKSAQGNMLFKGKPVDPAQVEAANAKLQARIKKLNNNMSAYKKGGVVEWEKDKFKARKKEKKNKQEQLAANQAALSEQDSINNLREQNAIALDDAIESYIATFGQCYAQAGTMYGSSIVISSDQDQKVAITPNEYNQLVSTLQNAASQFPSIMITLDMVDSDQDMQASISDVTSYIKNMPVTTGSWAMFALKSAVTAAVIAGTAIVGYNLYQGEEWNSSRAIDDAMDTQAGQQAQALAAQAKSAGDKAYNDAMNTSYGKSAAQAAQDATAAAQNAANAVMNSSVGQAVEKGWTTTVNALGYETQAQIDAAAQLAQARTTAQVNAAQAAQNLADAQAANQSWTALFGRLLGDTTAQNNVNNSQASYDQANADYAQYFA